MKRIFCDRCGEEIKEEPVRMTFTFSYISDPDKDISIDMKKRLIRLEKPLEDKDFCMDCIADIVDFALNGKVCDECVQQMMEENALLREEKKEESDTQGESDSSDLDWDKALNRMEQGKTGIHYMVPVEEIAKAMESIREDSRVTQGGSGQYIIPLQPIDPELIRKYKVLQQIGGGCIGNEIEKIPE